MAICLRKNIVDELNEADLLTILVDETKDKHGIEILSVAFRYVNKNVDVGMSFYISYHHFRIQNFQNYFVLFRFFIVERCVGFLAATDQSAAGIFQVLLDSLEKDGIYNLKDRLICQCYDGASVNSGRLGGLKIKFEEHFEKTIPYILYTLLCTSTSFSSNRNREESNRMC